MKNRSKVNFIFVSLAVLLVVGLFINNNKSKELLGAYIDGQYFDITPSKDSGYVVEKIVCDNNTVGEWDYDNWGITLTNLSEKAKCNIHFRKGVKFANTINLVDTAGKCPTVNDDGTVKVTSAESEKSLLCSAPDNYGTSYYYRGNVQNNYVRFANFYWRIVRINGDGSIRIIYDGTTAHQNGEASDDRIIGTSAFNEKSDDNAYVGYMYGTPSSSTYEETHANINNSDIKKYIDNWYEKNIKNTINEKYINDALFYNDRNFASTNTGTGVGNSMTYYTWDDSNFLNKSKKASLNFTNNNDVFSKANGNLKYFIALIEENEALLAGGYSKENTKYYLYSGIQTWTMSPGYYGGKNSSASLKIISNSGGISAGSHTFYQNGVKPVINLKPNSLKSGDGTINNPYTVE